MPWPCLSVGETWCFSNVLMTTLSPARGDDWVQKTCGSMWINLRKGLMNQWCDDVSTTPLERYSMIFRNPDLEIPRIIHSVWKLGCSEAPPDRVKLYNIYWMINEKTISWCKTIPGKARYRVPWDCLMFKIFALPAVGNPSNRPSLEGEQPTADSHNLWFEEVSVPEPWLWNVWHILAPNVSHHVYHQNLFTGFAQNGRSGCLGAQGLSQGFRSLYGWYWSKEV